MKDILTKEQRETVERAKALLADKWNYGVGEWVGVSEILLDIIGNLSKRGVKNYSEEELLAAYYAQYPTMTVQGCASEWVKCARFLGALEEK
jgi:hypothetical protein